MATALRWLTFQAGQLLVTVLMLLPVVGLITGLWPDDSVTVTGAQQLLSYTGLGQSIVQTLVAALLAPLLAFYLAFIIYSHYGLSHWWRRIEQQLTPILALPHLALALGLVVLFGGHSMLAGLTGLTLPPKSLWTLVAAICLKEIPFFLLILSALGRTQPLLQWRLQGRALGFNHYQFWFLIALPVLLPQARLALLAASAYTLSVVDVAAVVGPNIPELLAVSLYQWQTGFTAFDQTLAFWGNLVLLALLVVTVTILYAHEHVASYFARLGARSRCRLSSARLLSPLRWLAPLLVIINGLVMLSLLLQSLNTTTDDLLSWQLWQQEWLFMQTPLVNTLILGLVTAALGTALALLVLTLQRHHRRYWFDGIWLAAILLPQLSLVYGWQIIHAWLGADYALGWVTLSHLPFTFAYSYLVLKGPFRELSPHYETIAASLGYSPWQRWLRVRLRLLLPALMTSLALAFSVSVAQYVPTLMIGAGRIATITTEVVALSSGSDQAQVAIYLLLQAVLPLLMFLLALAIGQRTRGVTNAQY